MEDHKRAAASEGVQILHDAATANFNKDFDTGIVSSVTVETQVNLVPSPSTTSI